jgi:eukaryotic-like serine/threonine-protein kinase
MNDTNLQTYLGKFEILECYKKDHQSGVYLANHIFLGKKIILKTLDSLALEDKAIMERFNREAKILAKLDHPNIIKVLDYGYYESIFYLSFEYYEGTTLREIIQKNSLSELQKKNLLIQLFEALDYAHSHQIIHRDIKPENILVDESLNLKIADFGLALGLNDNNVTNQYSIVGTPGYMSPEQIRGEKLTIQSDLFSSGIIAYELYKGNNPFIGNDISQTINNILQFDENKLNELTSGLNDDTTKLLLLLLQKNCKKRIGTASDVLSLLGYTKAESVNKSPSTHKSGKIYVLSAIVFTIVCLIAWQVFYRNSSPVSPDKQNIKLNVNKNEIKQSVPVTGTIQEKSAIEKNPITTPENKLPAKSFQSEEKIPEPVTGFGKIFIECSPWADIYIDSQKKETTPLKDYISLTAGKHNITLKHPDYPDYTILAEIKKDQSTYLKFNLKSLFGYLDCKVFPWGEIYIDGEFKGSTPLPNLIALNPGEHKVLIRNTNYNDFQSIINIRKSQTVELKHNFTITDKNENK